MLQTYHDCVQSGFWKRRIGGADLMDRSDHAQDLERIRVDAFVRRTGYVRGLALKNNRDQSVGRLCVHLGPPAARPSQQHSHLTYHQGSPWLVNLLSEAVHLAQLLKATVD